MTADPQNADGPDTSRPEDVLWLLRSIAVQLEGVEDELMADGAPSFPVEAHRSLNALVIRIRGHAESIGERAERDWSRS